ncbi:hypothetical protein [Kitasatospora griseola]|uniref:hypothetical protein n=1 Tax=Kitasatospora griseola TaxID=2064 RepID=UPI003807F35D
MNQPTDPIRIGIVNQMILGNTDPAAANRMLDTYEQKIRNQALTEAAEMLAAEAARGIHIPYGSATDYANHYRTMLLAARTGQQPVPADAEQQVREQVAAEKQAGAR